MNSVQFVMCAAVIATLAVLCSATTQQSEITNISSKGPPSGLSSGNPSRTTAQPSGSTTGKTTRRQPTSPKTTGTTKRTPSTQKFPTTMKTSTTTSGATSAMPSYLLVLIPAIFVAATKAVY